jgi:ribosomal protein S18 acetylase RimI-like enzyme
MTQNDGFVIREATQTDAAALAVLAERTFRDAFAEFNTASDMDDYVSSTFTVEKLELELRDRRATYLVAEAEAHVIGYAKLYRGKAPECVSSENPVELARLYVLKSWHGRGPANALVQAAIDFGECEGFKSLWLGVWEQNTRAISFYSKWHFVPVGRQTFILGSDVQQDLVMCRSLDGDALDPAEPKA